MPVPYCLDDCGFVVEPEVRHVDSSSSILLSQDYFGYSGFFVKNLFTYLFLAVLGLQYCVGFSLVVASRSTLQVGCRGFSLWWPLHCRAQALGVWASVAAAQGLSSCGSRALEHRLNSSGAHASLLRDTWDLPGSRIKPMAPALAGGFYTTEPPGKPSNLILFWNSSVNWDIGIEIYTLLMLWIK